MGGFGASILMVSTFMFVSSEKPDVKYIICLSLSQAFTLTYAYVSLSSFGVFMQLSGVEGCVEITSSIFLHILCTIIHLCVHLLNNLQVWAVSREYIE